MKMSLGSEQVTRIFESRPVETATWLVTLDALRAIHVVIKNAKVTEAPDEIAAKRLISSLGNGDYSTVKDYIERSRAYPGMEKYAQLLGALSIRGRLDPSIVAVLSYKSNRLVKPKIDHNTRTFQLCESARGFNAYFMRLAQAKIDSDSYPSRVDLSLEIKSQTEFWIDK